MRTELDEVARTLLKWSRDTIWIAEYGRRKRMSTKSTLLITIKYL